MFAFLRGMLFIALIGVYRPALIANDLTSLEGRIDALTQSSTLAEIESITAELGAIESPTEVHMEALRKLIDKYKVARLVSPAIVRNIFSKPQWAKFPYLAAELLNSRPPRRVYDMTFIAIFKHAFWHQPELLRMLIQRDTVNDILLRFVLNLDHWRQSPELILEIIRLKRNKFEVLDFLKNSPKIEIYHESINEMLKLNLLTHNIISEILVRKELAEHPELIETLFKAGRVRGNAPQVALALSQEHWQNNPKLKTLCSDGEVTLNNLHHAFLIEGKAISCEEAVKNLNPND